MFGSELQVISNRPLVGLSAFQEISFVYPTKWRKRSGLQPVTHLFTHLPMLNAVLGCSSRSSGFKPHPHFAHLHLLLR